jgi:hypothetical protein
MSDIYCGEDGGIFPTLASISASAIRIEKTDSSASYLHLSQIHVSFPLSFE